MTNGNTESKDSDQHLSLGTDGTSGLDRRSFLKAMTTGASVMTAAGCLSSDDDSINAIYIWGYADSLVTDNDAAGRFFERAEKNGYNTVYMSIHVIEAATDDEVARFIRESNDRNLKVEALIGLLGADSMDGAEHHTERIIEYNTEKSNAECFDGIHYDIEPRSPDELNSFLSKYILFLDNISEVGMREKFIISEELTVAADIGWWWATDEPDKTYELVEHDVFDYISVMAYYDTTSEVRERLSMIVSETDTPYVLAVETMEFPGTEENHRTTFYEEGLDAVVETTDSITANPPSEGYLGIAYHYYGSSISSRDALREADLQTMQANPGDTIDIKTTVVFDTDFSDSALESKLVVQYNGDDETYTTKANITPSSGIPTISTLSWEVPSNIPTGEYDVAVMLFDTTFIDENQKVIGIRDDPVELDSIDAGTVTIHKGVS